MQKLWKSLFNIQFSVTEDKRNKEIFTFKKPREENFDSLTPWTLSPIYLYLFIYFSYRCRSVCMWTDGWCVFLLPHTQHPAVTTSGELARWCSESKFVLYALHSPLFSHLFSVRRRLCAHRRSRDSGGGIDQEAGRVEDRLTYSYRSLL